MCFMNSSDDEYSSLEDDDLMLFPVREVEQPEPPETEAPLPVPSHRSTIVTPPQIAGPPDPPTTAALRPPPVQFPALLTDTEPPLQRLPLATTISMPPSVSPQLTAQEILPLLPPATAVVPAPLPAPALQQSRSNATTVPERNFLRTMECKRLEKELKLITSDKVITTVDKITELLSHCQIVGCNDTTTVKTRIVGTTLEIWYVCSKGHRGKWTSSEEYQGMYANNLLMSSAILLSGNNFAKVELLSKFMGLGCPSSSSFHRVQRFYAIPAIEEWWSWMRNNIISIIDQMEVVLAGDGQNDSPGHSAKYLTYYMMVAEELVNYIVHVECVDKREVERKSPNMEKEALRRAIKSIKQVIKLKEMVTDASSSIIKMMREEFQEILHSLDIWHKAKNMRKCITQVAKLRGNNKIGAWTDHIINHFWYCCENCGRSEEKLKTMWISLLHHICNEHEWLDGKCTHHQPENHELPWFDRRDKDYEALQDIVLSPRLLNTLKFYVNFRHTGSLESVNSMSLMYAPKRCAFGMQAFKARKMLAAIDHNYHINRKSLVHEKGEVQVTRKYVSRTKRWDAQVIKEDKDYAYIPQMLAMTFERRKNDPGTMNDYMEMAPDDPRRISSTIAAVPPPSSRELFAAHQSRFRTKK
ncbi:hypothetical protein QZH41_016412 [Actinostola sp. cb2023]|nr:hypothetical protein QZH41_012016 [Actinostola sp. cb2023]KAK3727767.1 hypothetical protein QZH41_016412 [Actinostola sp. cb2023]